MLGAIIVFIIGWIIAIALGKLAGQVIRILRIDQIKDWSGLSDLAGAVTEKEFWRLVKIGFSAKRKQLANNLAAGLNFDRAKIQSMLRTLNLNDKIRAQDLAIVDWFRLAKNLKSYFN